MKTHLRFKETLVALFGAFGLTFVLTACQTNADSSGAAGAQKKVTVRLAYFPNVTHAPALVGTSKKLFEEALGDKGELKTFVVNAGPEAMNALLAGEIDMSYVGPSPAINTYIRSEGSALRVLAGACSGGAGLVARQDVAINSIKDLSGKRVAIPQLGNTQDVSCRSFTMKEGLKPREKGGTVEILPIKNPDILALFVKKELDATWVPEPWMSRLEEEAGAKVVVDERDLWQNRQFITTIVIVRKAFLEEHPEIVEAMLGAHVKSVEWLNANTAEAQTLVNEEIKRLTGKALSEKVLQSSWGRMEFLTDPLKSSIEAFVQAAIDAGYIESKDSDVSNMFDPQPLKNALQKSK